MLVTNKAQAATVRPFHETIVDAIRRCPLSGEILRLFQLIRETKIPKDHDEIVSVIDKRFSFLGAGKWAREIREVKESVLSQKQVSAKKAEGDKKGISLDDLQQETEKLLALLTDHQLGLMTWSGSMRERLQNLHKLTSQALGK